jgi:hypothetical protein
LARKAKSRKPSIERFKIKVTATAVSIGHRGRGLSPLHPNGDADSNIKIEGALDRLVSNRDAALVCVFCGAEVGDAPGGAIGVTTAWQWERQPDSPLAMKYPNADVGHYLSAGDRDVVTVSLCDFVDGHCTICLGVPSEEFPNSKSGFKGCFSLVMTAGQLEAYKIPGLVDSDEEDVAS